MPHTYQLQKLLPFTVETLGMNHVGAAALTCLLCCLPTSTSTTIREPLPGPELPWVTVSAVVIAAVVWEGEPCLGSD